MESPPAVGVADPVSETGYVPSTPRAASSEHSPFLIGSRAAGDPTADAAGSSPVAVPYDSRALDLVVAAALLLLVLPLMCFCALAVLATSRGPLLFRQSRIGRNGEQFHCLKFRTMVQRADLVIDELLKASPEAKAEWQALQKLKRDPRITPVGAFLRRYCLDELPQLFNVLAGQMSIVGPRPIVSAEIDRFGGSFAAYCSVRPGLTGLWQVSGRHLLSYEERVALDAEYARSKSLSLDLLILWKTVPVVLLGQNE